MMPELKPDVTAEAIEALEGMAETWFEKNGSVRKAIMAVPLNCQNVEHAKEARELIRRLVRDTYMEGLYNGRISHATRPDGGDSLREALESIKHMADAVSMVLSVDPANPVGRCAKIFGDKAQDALAEKDGGMKNLAQAFIDLSTPAVGGK